MKRTRQAAKKSLVTDARAVIDTCAGINVRLAARRISWFLEERMRRTGMNIAQFGLMTHVAAAPDDTIGALAERCGLDQSTLSRNLRLLEREGLVEIVTAEKDLRRRAVWLTEQGASRLEAAMPVWRSAHTALSALIRPEQVRALACRTQNLVKSGA
jgi:DNA-binding MarR family transcriptional regulator